jgi:hypothetical protein
MKSSKSVETGHRWHRFHGWERQGVPKGMVNDGVNSTFYGAQIVLK